MQINDDILHDFSYCQYKAFLKSKNQEGILSEYQIFYNQLKQNQKFHFEKTLSENNTLICTNPIFDNKIPKEGISLNQKFTNTNINLILDGIEFAGNNTIIPFFITPFEKITIYDKQLIALQSYYIQNEFNIYVESYKVINGKLLNQTKFKFSLLKKSIKKSVDDLNKTISDSIEPSLVLNNHCIVCEYRVFCMEKAKADDNLSLLDRATTKIIEKYKKKGIFTIQQLSYLYKPRRRKIQPHLINISNSIFGKIYFPVYSNRLKDLGKYIGATWTSNKASGVQSLVWRHYWEESQDEKFKQLLITYNLEDCLALKLLTDKLIQIQESASTLPDIDFVINPKKNSSLLSSQIHQQFDEILKFAHETYDNSKISFQSIRQDEALENNKVGGKIGHKGASRTIPKAKKVIIVPIKRICPTHKCKLTKIPKRAERTITDLVFTKFSVRKTVIKYVGHKSYCPLCKKYFSPPQIEKIGTNHFGHNFKAWVVYQRLFLRLPFDIIRLNLLEMFNENISQGSINNVFKPFFFTINTQKTII